MRLALEFIVLIVIMFAAINADTWWEWLFHCHDRAVVPKDRIRPVERHWAENMYVGMTALCDARYVSVRDDGRAYFDKSAPINVYVPRGAKTIIVTRLGDDRWELDLRGLGPYVFLRMMAYHKPNVRRVIVDDEEES